MGVSGEEAFASWYGLLEEARPPPTRAKPVLAAAAGTTVASPHVGPERMMGPPVE